MLLLYSYVVMGMLLYIMLNSATIGSNFLPERLKYLAESVFCKFMTCFSFYYEDNFDNQTTFTPAEFKSYAHHSSALVINCWKVMQSRSWGWFQLSTFLKLLSWLPFMPISWLAQVKKLLGSVWLCKLLLFLMLLGDLVRLGFFQLYKRYNFHGCFQ